MQATFRHPAGSAVLGVAAALILTPLADAAAQVTVTSRAAEITLAGRVHSQFNTTSVTGEPWSEFLIRRARFTAEVVINDVVSGKVQPEFGEGRVSLKDAYLRFTFGPTFRATFGQMKRPFDLFELTSSTEMLVVERTGGIRGVGTCSGTGGLCSFSRFTESLDYSDRDIGVFLEGSPSGRYGWSLSVTNGTGANTEDENGAKSYTGRVMVGAGPNVTVAGNVAVHDYRFAGETEYATAFGADVEIGDYDRGLHVQAGIVTGDNWRRLVAGDAVRFFALQGIVTYKSLVAGNRYVSAIEPVGRLSVGNPDTGTPSDGGVLLTPGFMMHFVGRNKIAANVDVWMPSVGDTEYSLKVQSFLYF